MLYTYSFDAPIQFLQISGIQLRVYNNALPLSALQDLKLPITGIAR